MHASPTASSPTTRRARRRPTARSRKPPPSCRAAGRSPRSKDPKDWKIAGKPLKRLDTADKVTGKMMLRHRPQAAGHAERRDQGLPGVRRQGEELRRRQGRRHEGRQEGGAGRRQVRSPWSPTPGGTPRPRSMRCRSSGTRARTPRSPARSIAEWLEEGLDARETPSSATSNGDAKAAIAGAAKKVEAVYAYPYQNHACMEPMNATVLYTADKCEVWTGTQNGEAAFAATHRRVRPAVPTRARCIG